MIYIKWELFALFFYYILPIFFIDGTFVNSFRIAIIKIFAVGEIGNAISLKEQYLN